MRLYLDTNIVIFLLTEDVKSIDNDTYAMLSDDSNVLFTSAICVQELIILRQTGKLFTEKKWNRRREKSLTDMVLELGIEIVPVNELHLRRLDSLPMLAGHSDPFDRLIIAQAIADKATLVSSDKAFPRYAEQGLAFHMNKR